MRGLGVSLSLLLALLFSSEASTAGVMPTPIHPERNNVPSSIRRDLVLADLEAVLDGPVSPTSITTGPYASSRDGLCQRDVIHLDYERVRPDGKAFRPVGIHRVDTEYHLLAERMKGDEEGLRKACRKLAREKNIYWATSDDDHRADSALSDLERAVAAMRAGTHVTVNCSELLDVRSQDQCESEFLRASPMVSNIYRCFERSETILTRCSRFHMDKYEVTIVLTYGKVANGGHSTAIEMKPRPIIVF